MPRDKLELLTPIMSHIKPISSFDELTWECHTWLPLVQFIADVVVKSNANTQLHKESIHSQKEIVLELLRVRIRLPLLSSEMRDTVFRFCVDAVFSVYERMLEE